MFQILLILFILVPIVEIGVFIQVGDSIGLVPTIAIVIGTAVLGVNLLKQQGFRAWQEIQQTMVQGQVPAIEMAAGAQLLFAGGLLLTPGFVTDGIGFLLMVPAVRMSLAKRFVQHKGQTASFYSAHTSSFSRSQTHSSSQDSGRTIEGEFEEKK